MGGFIKFVMGGDTNISLSPPPLPLSLSLLIIPFGGGGGGGGIHTPYGLDEACAQHCAGKNSTIIGDTIGCAYMYMIERRESSGRGVNVRNKVLLSF